MYRYIDIDELMRLCFYTHLVYCTYGGHYCVRVDMEDLECPFGCNVY